jgi:hypothetical protein
VETTTTRRPLLLRLRLPATERGRSLQHSYGVHFAVPCITAGLLLCRIERWQGSSGDDWQGKLTVPVNNSRKSGRNAKKSKIVGVRFGETLQLQPGKESSPGATECAAGCTRRSSF